MICTARTAAARINPKSSYPRPDSLFVLSGRYHYIKTRYKNGERVCLPTIMGSV